MSNTRDAVKYALEALSVSTAELKRLIESSKGYDGEDYSRWLASKVVSIAEGEEGYSYLLSKWFNIIKSISDEYSDDSMSEGFVNAVRHLCVGDVFSVGFEPIDGEYDEDEEVDLSDEEMLPKTVFGKSLNGLDWYDGLDVLGNLDFIDTKLPDYLRERLYGKKPFTLVIKGFGNSYLGKYRKNCDIFVSAKREGIVCQDSFSLLLYRLSSIVKAFEATEGRCLMRVVFLTDSRFFFSKDNASTLNNLLGTFSYSGFSAESGVVYKKSFTDEKYIVCCLESSDTVSPEEGFLFKDSSIYGDKIIFSDTKKRYFGGNGAAQSLRKNDEFAGRVMTISISNDCKVAGKSKGSNGAMGYLCWQDDNSPSIYPYPVEGCRCVGITKENILDVIYYYGVIKSLIYHGFSGYVKEPIDGNDEFLWLAYNCLPIFLFDPGTNIKDIGKIEIDGRVLDLKSPLSFNGSEVQGLLSRGESYFSYESKELIEIAKKYVEEFGDDVSQLTFSDVRDRVGRNDLSVSFIRALNTCKEKVAEFYKKVFD